MDALINRKKHDGTKDFFTFIKDKKTAIDINSDWFQELWYPLSKKRHILLGMPLLEWFGYDGAHFNQKQKYLITTL
jgi:hypothetical protein